MSRTRVLVIVLVASLGSANLASADDAARAVIDKAIKALGNKDVVTKYKAQTFKAKGKLYNIGDGVDFSGEWAIEIPDKMHARLEVDINGMKLTIVRVWNKGKIWTKVGNDTMEVTDKDELAEEQESLFNQFVMTLVPLTDKAFTLSSLGEVKVGTRAAVGVKVAHKGRRDVDLYFDKENSLLLKAETRVKEMDGKGQEVTQETLLSDYKNYEGLQSAQKMLVNRDGKKYLEVEVTELHPKESLDEATFAKP